MLRKELFASIEHLSLPNYLLFSSKVTKKLIAGLETELLD